ncbi:MAG: DUF4440 domain-containing protein [Gammaproteobacteria bacterium]|nr:DUF4440 domain-containing protein [Gammaproteobacteria bacterium]
MRNSCPRLLPGLVGALLATNAFADGQREDAAFFAAISSDPATLSALLADRFVYRTVRGTTLGKQALIDELRSGRTRVASPRISDFAVVAQEGTQVSTGVVTLEVLGADGPTTLRSRFTHVWVREAKGWRLLFREASIL